MQEGAGGDAGEMAVTRGGGAPLLYEVRVGGGQGEDWLWQVGRFWKNISTGNTALVISGKYNLPQLFR